MIMRGLTHALSPGARRARLSILIFHRVLARPDPLFADGMEVRRFQQVMGWVRRWFQVLPLEVAVRQLGQGTLPARALCISFDDGYADNASQALPVLRHYGLPATLFVASGHLDGGRMWNDSVIEAVRRTRHRQLELELALPDGGPTGYALRTLAERRRAIDSLLARIKYLAPPLRQQMVARVADAAETPLPTNLMLRSEQLRTLQQRYANRRPHRLAPDPGAVQRSAGALGNGAWQARSGAAGAGPGDYFCLPQWQARARLQRTPCGHGARGRLHRRRDHRRRCGRTGR
jgi:Polysaccharide deacetylase